MVSSSPEQWYVSMLDAVVQIRGVLRAAAELQRATSASRRGTGTVPSGANGGVPDLPGWLQ